MLTKKFDFEIPDSLIALEPANPRDSSKLIEVSNVFNILDSFGCVEAILEQAR